MEDKELGDKGGRQDHVGTQGLVDKGRSDYGGTHGSRKQGEETDCVGTLGISRQGEEIGLCWNTGELQKRRRNRIVMEHRRLVDKGRK